AAIFMLVITQLWRFISEFIRADYRGLGKISIYQFMSLFIIPYMIISVRSFPASQALVPDIMRGGELLQHPAIILFIILSWLSVFYYTGVSKMTDSTITFSINKNNI